MQGASIPVNHDFDSHYWFYYRRGWVENTPDVDLLYKNLHEAKMLLSSTPESQGSPTISA